MANKNGELSKARAKGEEEDWQSEVQRVIETSLYYCVKCPHCEIVFFIEEAVDGGYSYGLHSEPTFRLTCPRCKAPIEQASVNRLKLNLEKVVMHACTKFKVGCE